MGVGLGGDGAAVRSAARDARRARRASHRSFCREAREASACEPGCVPHLQFSHNLRRHLRCLSTTRRDAAGDTVSSVQPPAAFFACGIGPWADARDLAPCPKAVTSWPHQAPQAQTFQSRAGAGQGPWGSVAPPHRTLHAACAPQAPRAPQPARADVHRGESRAAAVPRHYRPAACGGGALMICGTAPPEPPLVNFPRDWQPAACGPCAVPQHVGSSVRGLQAPRGPRRLAGARAPGPTAPPALAARLIWRPPGARGSRARIRAPITALAPDNRRPTRGLGPAVACSRTPGTACCGC